MEVARPTVAQFMEHQAMGSAPQEVRPLTPRELSAMEASQARQKQATQYRTEYDAAVAHYEELRSQVHDVLGRIHAANVQYSNFLGVAIPTHPAHVFGSINIPTLKPSRLPDLSPGWTTTQAAIEQYQNSLGRW